MTTALALISLGLPIGFVIGLIGIGGVLLTPALAHLFGRDIHESVSLSLASFVLAGVVAAMRGATDDATLARGRLDFSRRDHSCGFGGSAPSARDSESVVVSDQFRLRCLCRIFLTTKTVGQR